MEKIMESVRSVSVAKPKSNLRWRIIYLVGLCTVINYIDRVNFSIATPVLMKEFKMGTGEMGILMSAFFLAYTAAQLPTGVILNKYGPKKFMGWASFGWGAVTALTAACTNFFTFFLARVGLGLTEAPLFPASARVVSVWVPKKERAFATTFYNGATRVGSAFAPPLVTFIIAAWGWQMSFVVTGLLAIGFGFLWLWLYHEPADHPSITQEELLYIRQDEVVKDDGSVHSHPIPMSHLVTYPVVLKAALGYFFLLYFWTGYIFWLPTYLMMSKGLSLKAMGLYATIPYIVALIAELVVSKSLDQWLASGAKLNTVRRVACGVGMIGAAASVYICLQVTSITWSMVWLSVALAFYSVGSNGGWSIPADIAPYGQAGGVGAIYAFIGNFGAFVAPAIIGYVVETSYGWYGGFFTLAAAGALSALFYIFNTYERLVPRKRDAVIMNS